jgi:hypothetical protein
MNEMEYRNLSRDLEALCLDPAASIRYEVMSDALIWSDELLRDRPARQIWCMRPVFRYRTGLILRTDFEEFRQNWGRHKRSFLYG